jgi:hypothetical protein
MLLGAVATTVCTVVAIRYAIDAVKRARGSSDTAWSASALLGEGRWRRAAQRIRPWLRALPTVTVLVLLLLSLIYQYDSLARIDFPSWNEIPPYKEVESTAEWQTWRKEIHQILSIKPLTESDLSRALRLKKPGLRDSSTESEALRLDQAIADVLLSYDGVKDILGDRIGIRTNFLGTGLSTPLGSTRYSLAAVHEYLVENHSDAHDHIWLWKIKAIGEFFSRPLQSLIAGEKENTPPANQQKKRLKFADDLKEILLRVKNKDHPFPPMIRFARLNEEQYKETLGRPRARRVFTSNLTEVWDLTIQQAAEKSGYVYANGGDTLFIWVYVPYHSAEFTPATWREVLARLPDWLESKEQ